jgi:hypothetical protein
VHSQQASGAALAKNYLGNNEGGGRNGPVDELAPAAEWLLTRLSAAAAAVHGVPARRRELVRACHAAPCTGDSAVDISRVAWLYRACFSLQGHSCPSRGLGSGAVAAQSAPQARASPRPEPVTQAPRSPAVPQATREGPGVAQGGQPTDTAITPLPRIL